VLCVYQNIKDLRKFEQTYLQVVLPEFVKFDGLVSLKITDFDPLIQQLPKGMEGMKMMIEAGFKSKEDFERFMDGDGQTQLQATVTDTNMDTGIFIIQDRIFRR
jgi:hypothetical protein